MAARLDQEAKRRAEKKPAAVENTALPDVTTFIDSEGRVWAVEDNGQIPTGRVVGRVVEGRVVELGKKKFEQAGTLLSDLPFPADVWDADLWDEAVESLGRSARLMEELAESTGEAIARIAARGDRIDRIQKDTRALLNALVASEADA
jgi:hypothetical protein